jgi:ketosteroid isomerase-like protein
MPEENVELVLAAYKWGDRHQSLARNRWHPDGEYVNSREDPDHATFRGLDAIEGLFASWIEAYPDVRIIPVEAREHGDRVFLWVRFNGHVADSDVPLQMELAHVITIEDGRMRRLEEYMDRAEALSVAGLGE